MRDGVPMTVVYNANGQPQYRADDMKAAAIDIPVGSVQPGTWVHEFPSGSYLKYQDTKLEVFSETGGKIFTAVEPHNCSAIRDKLNQQNSKSHNKVYTGWLENAHDYSVNDLATFTAKWKVPTSPTSTLSPRGIALFNALQKSGDNTIILQPVLGWDMNGIGKKWAISSWSLPEGSGCTDSGHMPYQDVSVGDVIQGSLTYDSSDNNWTVTTEDTSTTTTVKSECISNALGTNQNLDIFGGALEGHYLYDNNDLPGNTKFYSMSYKDASGNDLSITLEKYVDSGATQFTGLDVDLSNQPSEATMKSGKS